MSASELATIRDFLTRRERLSADARARVSCALADGVAETIGGIEPGSMPPERLLETIVTAKAAGGTPTVPPDHQTDAEVTTPSQKAGARSETPRRPIPPFTDEHEEFRAAVHRFAQSELAPRCREWEQSRSEI